MKTLHILNGDATLSVFQQTQIPGEVLIWRELLSEGPVSKTNLWEVRLPWICENLGANVQGYQKMVIEEVNKLQNLDDDVNIILWFEFDLVCQINLIYILSLLNEKVKPHQTVFLICPASFKDMPNFRGLGELNAIQLKSLEKTKVRLQKQDLQLAAKAWNLYVENDPTQIRKFLDLPFGNLGLLKPALVAHLSRFPSPTSKLNHIEEALLKIITSGTQQKQQIYTLFWNHNHIYGMTDLQIDFYLKQLAVKGYFKYADLY